MSEREDMNVSFAKDRIGIELKNYFIEKITTHPSFKLNYF